MPNCSVVQGTALQFPLDALIKPYLDNKMSIFEEYGACDSVDWAV